MSIVFSCDDKPTLIAYLYGEVEPAVRKSVDAHLATCAACAAEVRALGGFQYFCPGFVVSHGYPLICAVNVPVTVAGLSVTPGDLLHGDVNGLLTIPGEIAAKVADEAERIRRAERDVLEFVRRPGLTVERLRAFQERFRH